MISLMGMVMLLMPSLSARTAASTRLARLVKGEGIRTPSTFSGPRAEAAMAATRLESMPPERPRRTPLKPHFCT